ncbi:unnamed protein product [Urochloa decumbens]|uniref:Uncharacterized protein n=1 Tax=Urochloa decumbens TaxID=240449 RepID=A0ABC9BLK6_9POAL
MAYEAAAAVALRGHSGEEKGGARSHGRPKQVEEKVVMRCGVLRIFKRVLPLSGTSGSGKK